MLDSLLGYTLAVGVSILTRGGYCCPGLDIHVQDSPFGPIRARGAKRPNGYADFAILLVGYHTVSNTALPVTPGTLGGDDTSLTTDGWNSRFLVGSDNMKLSLFGLHGCLPSDPV